MIVSINPFKYISSYGEQLIPEYQKKPATELPPHLYAIAQQAYNSVSITQKLRSICRCYLAKKINQWLSLENQVPEKRRLQKLF